MYMYIHVQAIDNNLSPGERVLSTSEVPEAYLIHSQHLISATGLDHVGLSPVPFCLARRGLSNQSKPGYGMAWHVLAAIFTNHR